MPRSAAEKCSSGSNALTKEVCLTHCRREMDSNHYSRSEKGLAFFETTLIDLRPFTSAGSNLPRQRDLEFVSSLLQCGVCIPAA